MIFLSVFKDVMYLKKKLKVSAYDNYLSVAKPITHAFISLILFLLPLVMTNGYYNITETKLITFYMISGGYLLVQFFVFISFVLNKGKDFWKSLSFKFNFLDIAFISFGASYVLSGILSSYGPKDVLFGIGSRYQGVVTIIVYVLLYFVLTRTFSFSVNCLVWAGAGFSIVSVIAILNGVSVDPLGFYSELSDKNQGMFISTIGNINFYSAYYNNLLPLLVVGFCKAIDKKALIIFGLFLVIGSVGMVFTASESFLLGFIISMLLILVFVMTDVKALKRFLISCCLFLTTITIYTKLYHSGIAKNIFNFKPSGLMLIVSKPVVISALIIVCAVIFIIANTKTALLPLIKKAYCVILVVFFTLGIGGIVLVNTSFKNIDLGALNEYLRFSDEWGSNRGRNWIFCIKEFTNAPLVSKFFGFGPETYHHLTAKTNFYENKSLDQVHNEYLHYLISVGVFGLVSYLCIVFDTIKKCVKNIGENAVAIGILSALVAYWIQAVVNIAQPFTTPIMFIFITILSGMLKINLIQSYEYE